MHQSLIEYTSIVIENKKNLFISAESHVRLLHF